MERKNVSQTVVQQEPEFRKEQYAWLRGQEKLDLLCIDEELIKIPEFLRICGEHAAYANENRDRLKDAANVIDALIAVKLRIPDGNGKIPSETQLDRMVSSDVEYREARRLELEAKRDSELWSNLFDALKTKSYTINTVALLVQVGFISKDYVTDKIHRDIRNVSSKE